MKKPKLKLKVILVGPTKDSIGGGILPFGAATLI
jgi:hypothetical protein